jgi:hypothetical protein
VSRVLDTMICQFGVMFFPDKDRGYREAHCVLTRGGRYLFSVWDAHRYNAFGRIAHEVIGARFPADPPRFYEVPFGYYLIDPIKESPLAPGFGGIEVSVVQQRRPALVEQPSGVRTRCERGSKMWRNACSPLRTAWVNASRGRPWSSLTLNIARA